MKALRVLAVVVVALAAVASFTAGAPARAQAPPAEQRQPTVQGTALAGNTVTADVGQWTNSPTGYRFQWNRCDAAGETRNCVPIARATARRYKLVADDAGHQVNVNVTACNRDGCSTANSKGVVVYANERPQPIDPPTIAGDPQVGETLTSTQGTWTGYPTNFSTEWLSCDTAGNNCRSTGSRGDSYGVRTADSGHTLRVRVTARNGRGPTSTTSPQTAVVGAPTGGGGGAVPVSRVNLPDRLVISGVSFSPNPAQHLPITARFKVTDTRGRTIQGALVYAIGLPYAWAQAAPEQPTGADGWATITIVPTRALPRNGALVLFVRTRKPGDNLLAGVSTRRLVQVTVRG
jgi:hypothetical protein